MSSASSSGTLDEVRSSGISRDSPYNQSAAESMDKALRLLPPRPIFNSAGFFQFSPNLKMKRSTIRKRSNPPNTSLGLTPTNLPTGAILEEASHIITSSNSQAVVFRGFSDEKIVFPNLNRQARIKKLLNSLSEGNLTETARTLFTTVLNSSFYEAYFAKLIVFTRILREENNTSLYTQLLSTEAPPSLRKYVEVETFRAARALLNAPFKNVPSSSPLHLCTTDEDQPYAGNDEKKQLRIIGHFIGQYIIAKNRTIPRSELDLRNVLLLGYQTGRLTITLPFICTVMSYFPQSLAFNDIKQPWTRSILIVLAEMNTFPLIDTLKFKLQELEDSLSASSDFQVTQQKTEKTDFTLQSFLENTPTPPQLLFYYFFHPIASNPDYVQPDAVSFFFQRGCHQFTPYHVHSIKTSYPHSLPVAISAEHLSKMVMNSHPVYIHCTEKFPQFRIGIDLFDPSYPSSHRAIDSLLEHVSSSPNVIPSPNSLELLESLLNDLPTPVHHISSYSHLLPTSQQFLRDEIHLRSYDRFLLLFHDLANTVFRYVCEKVFKLLSFYSASIIFHDAAFSLTADPNTFTRLSEHISTHKTDPATDFENLKKLVSAAAECQCALLAYPFAIEYLDTRMMFKMRTTLSEDVNVKVREYKSNISDQELNQVLDEVSRVVIDSLLDDVAYSFVDCVTQQVMQALDLFIVEELNVRQRALTFFGNEQGRILLSSLRIFNVLAWTHRYPEENICLSYGDLNLSHLLLIDDHLQRPGMEFLSCPTNATVYPNVRPLFSKKKEFAVVPHAVKEVDERTKILLTHLSFFLPHFPKSSPQRTLSLDNLPPSLLHALGSPIIRDACGLGFSQMFLEWRDTAGLKEAVEKLKSSTAKMFTIALRHPSPEPLINHLLLFSRRQFTDFLNEQASSIQQRYDSFLFQFDFKILLFSYSVAKYAAAVTDLKLVQLEKKMQAEYGLCDPNSLEVNVTRTRQDLQTFQRAKQVEDTVTMQNCMRTLWHRSFSATTSSQHYPMSVLEKCESILEATIRKERINIQRASNELKMIIVLLGKTHQKVACEAIMKLEMNYSNLLSNKLVHNNNPLVTPPAYVLAYHSLATQLLHNTLIRLSTQFTHFLVNASVPVMAVNHNIFQADISSQLKPLMPFNDPSLAPTKNHDPTMNPLFANISWVTRQDEAQLLQTHRRVFSQLSSSYDTKQDQQDLCTQMNRNQSRLIDQTLTACETPAESNSFNPPFLKTLQKQIIKTSEAESNLTPPEGDLFFAPAFLHLSAQLTFQKDGFPQSLLEMDFSNPKQSYSPLSMILASTFPSLETFPEEARKMITDTVVQCLHLISQTSTPYGLEGTTLGLMRALLTLPVQRNTSFPVNPRFVNMLRTPFPVEQTKGGPQILSQAPTPLSFLTRHPADYIRTPIKPFLSNFVISSQSSVHITRQQYAIIAQSIFNVLVNGLADAESIVSMLRVYLLLLMKTAFFITPRTEGKTYTIEKNEYLRSSSLSDLFAKIEANKHLPKQIESLVTLAKNERSDTQIAIEGFGLGGFLVRDGEFLSVVNENEETADVTESAVVVNCDTVDTFLAILNISIELAAQIVESSLATSTSPTVSPSVPKEHDSVFRPAPPDHPLVKPCQQLLDVLFVIRTEWNNISPFISGVILHKERNTAQMTREALKQAITFINAKDIVLTASFHALPFSLQSIRKVTDELGDPSDTAGRVFNLVQSNMKCLSRLMEKSTPLFKQRDRITLFVPRAEQGDRSSPPSDSPEAKTENLTSGAEAAITSITKHEIQLLSLFRPGQTSGEEAIKFHAAIATGIRQMYLFERALLENRPRPGAKEIMTNFFHINIQKLVETWANQEKDVEEREENHLKGKELDEEADVEEKVKIREKAKEEERAVMMSDFMQQMIQRQFLDRNQTTTASIQLMSILVNQLQSAQAKVVTRKPLLEDPIFLVLTEVFRRTVMYHLEGIDDPAETDQCLVKPLLAYINNTIRCILWQHVSKQVRQEMAKVVETLMSFVEQEVRKRLPVVNAKCHQRRMIRWVVAEDGVSKDFFVSQVDSTTQTEDTPALTQTHVQILALSRSLCDELRNTFNPQTSSAEARHPDYAEATLIAMGKNGFFERWKMVHVPQFESHATQPVDEEETGLMDKEDVNAIDKTGRGPTLSSPPIQRQFILDTASSEFKLFSFLLDFVITHHTKSYKQKAAAGVISRKSMDKFHFSNPTQLCQFLQQMSKACPSLLSIMKGRFAASFDFEPRVELFGYWNGGLVEREEDRLRARERSVENGEESHFHYHRIVTLAFAPSLPLLSWDAECEGCVRPQCVEQDDLRRTQLAGDFDEDKTAEAFLYMFNKPLVAEFVTFFTTERMTAMEKQGLWTESCSQQPDVDASSTAPFLATILLLHSEYAKLAEAALHKSRNGEHTHLLHVLCLAVQLAAREYQKNVERQRRFNGWGFKHLQTHVLECQPAVSMLVLIWTVMNRLETEQPTTLAVSILFSFVTSPSALTTVASFALISLMTHRLNDLFKSDTLHSRGTACQFSRTLGVPTKAITSRVLDGLLERRTSPDVSWGVEAVAQLVLTREDVFEGQSFVNFREQCREFDRKRTKTELGELPAEN